MPLTSYVLEHALRQVGAWRADGLDVGVALNLSGRTLVERDLPDQIEARCTRWNVPTNRLVLQITESMVVAMGCDQGQGFSFSRALPAAQFTTWLADRERRAVAFSV